MTVAGEAFCGTCDHYRRRANNLGLQTREVTSAFRSGSLASVLGISEQELARQIGASDASGMGAGARHAGGGTGGVASAAKVVPKAPMLGRLCRMCRQVRAPVVGATLCSGASILLVFAVYFGSSASRNCCYSGAEGLFLEGSSACAAKSTPPLLVRPCVRGHRSSLYLWCPSLRSQPPFFFVLKGKAKKVEAVCRWPEAVVLPRL
jgi:hypothetical protein